ncbi:MAG: hypothetical protein Q8936_11040 [Bacillota bacterium]|nr:hypothetical protein [Bacillota bacterium]
MTKLSGKRTGDKYNILKSNTYQLLHIDHIYSPLYLQLQNIFIEKAFFSTMKKKIIFSYGDFYLDSEILTLQNCNRSNTDLETVTLRKAEYICQKIKICRED